jgi:hypothetical protein
MGKGVVGHSRGTGCAHRQEEQELDSHQPAPNEQVQPRQLIHINFIAVKIQEKDLGCHGLMLKPI